MAKKPSAPVKVRRADQHRTRKTRAMFAVFRFMLYGFVGVASEVFFYNLVKFGRRVPVLEVLFRFDWRVDDRLHLNHIWDAPLVSLYGQCSLWMFLVYGVCAFFFIERWYRLLVHRHVALRAVAYGLTILAFELVSGWALWKLTGYKIWYYIDAANIFEMTSWYILPIWMVTGLIVELLYRELMDPDLVKALESPLPPKPDPTLLGGAQP